MTAFKPFLFDDTPQPVKSEARASFSPPGFKSDEPAPQQESKAKPVSWPLANLEGVKVHRREDAPDFDARADAQSAPSAEAAPQPAPEAEPEVDLQPMLEAAREAGYRQGYEEARAAIQEERMNEAQSQLEAIQAALSALPAQLQELDQRVTESAGEEAARLTLEMLKKSFPRVSQRVGFDEIIACFEENLPDLMGHSRLVIQVGEEHIDQLKMESERISKAHGFEGKLILLARPELTGADIKIEWADGGIERSNKAIWGPVDEALDQLWASQEQAPSSSTPNQATTNDEDPNS